MKFDTWLKRGSYISQILLVIIAIFGYFYTVIPIFEKQKLNEELIQAQFKLKEIDEKYQITYANYRNIRVNGMFMGALMECTGLLERAKPLPPLGYPLPKEEFTTINLGACFKEQFKEFLLSNSLNNKDQLLLTNVIAEATDKLVTIYDPTIIHTYKTRRVFYDEARSIINNNSEIDWGAN